MLMSAMNIGSGGSASLVIICYPYQGLSKSCGEVRKEENLNEVQQYARTPGGKQLVDFAMTGNQSNRRNVILQQLLRSGAIIFVFRYLHYRSETCN